MWALRLILMKASKTAEYSGPSTGKELVQDAHNWVPLRFLGLTLIEVSVLRCFGVRRLSGSQILQPSEK